MEPNPNTSASKFSFIILLAALGMMVAVTFMPKKQQPEEKKPAAAEQKKTPDAKPATEEPEVKTTKGGKLTPMGVLVKTAKNDEAIREYDVMISLQQPRTPKEAKDTEILEKIRETLHLYYKKRAANNPLRDTFRLESINGFNKCTDFCYTSSTAKVIVYRPGAPPLKLAAGDKRLPDVFKLGLHTVADDIVAKGKSGKYALSMIEESHSFMPDEPARPMYVIEMKLQGEERIVVFVDRKTFALRAVEMYTFNKKGKTEIDRYALSRRTAWSTVKTASHDASWYTRASNYKNRKCMR